MKITVCEKRVKAGEALSPKLQMRKKFDALDDVLDTLPFFERVMGMGAQDWANSSSAVMIGPSESSSRARNEKLAKDIFGDFSDYVDASVTSDDGSGKTYYYIAIQLKPEFWQLSVEDAADVLRMIDRACRKAGYDR